MKKEFDEELCRIAPHLYGDRNKSMQVTAMIWGFDFSDGWYKITYDLSIKLEALIVKFLEENKDNLYCMYCARKESNHTKFYTFDETGNKDISIENIENYLAFHPSTKPESIFSCDNFDPSYPRCAQAKEKYRNWKILHDDIYR